jgi:hypothetical protein
MEALVPLAELVVKNGKSYELHRKYISYGLWNAIKRNKSGYNKEAVEAELDLVGNLYKLVRVCLMTRSNTRGLALGLLCRMAKEEADALPSCR